MQLALVFAARSDTIQVLNMECGVGRDSGNGCGRSQLSAILARPLNSSGPSILLGSAEVVRACVSRRLSVVRRKGPKLFLSLSGTTMVFAELGHAVLSLSVLP